MKKLESVDAQSRSYAAAWQTEDILLYHSAMRRMTSSRSCGPRCPGRS